MVSRPGLVLVHPAGPPGSEGARDYENQFNHTGVRKQNLLCNTRLFDRIAIVSFIDQNADASVPT